MSEKSYREGHDPAPVAPATEAPPHQSPSAEPGTGSWFERSARGDKEVPAQSTTPSSASDECFTAALLVQTLDGTVVVVSSLPSIQKHHEATPHEVLRMCEDVRDQVSSLRTIGEVVRLLSMGQNQSRDDIIMALGGPDALARFREGKRKEPSLRDKAASMAKAVTLPSEGG